MASPQGQVWLVSFPDVPLVWEWDWTWSPPVCLWETPPGRIWCSCAEQWHDQWRMYWWIHHSRRHWNCVEDSGDEGKGREEERGERERKGGKKSSRGGGREGHKLLDKQKRTAIFVSSLKEAFFRYCSNHSTCTHLHRAITPLTI